MPGIRSRTAQEPMIAAMLREWRDDSDGFQSVSIYPFQLWMSQVIISH